MPKVTVVIPNYNGKKYLIGCVQSLLAEKWREFDICIVDNGSQDESIEDLHKYGIPFATFSGDNTNREMTAVFDETARTSSGSRASETERIRVIQLQENTGFCHAVNVGITASTAPYVFLLNNDTTIMQGCVEKLYLFLEQHPEAFSAGARMLSMKQPEMIDDAGDYLNALGYAFAAGKGRQSIHFQKQRRIFAACAGAALYRRAGLDRIGLFDENHFAYLEDIDIGYRARIHGYQNYIVPEATVYHAGSAVSGSRHNQFKVNLSSRNSVYLIYKNQPFLQWLLNLPFLTVGYLIKLLFFTAKGLGGTYLKGVLKGICLITGRHAREHKVKFRLRNLPYYIKIQIELWVNLIRMVIPY